jgi:hypothetical protein
MDESEYFTISFAQRLEGSKHDVRLRVPIHVDGLAARTLEGD